MKLNSKMENFIITREAQSVFAFRLIRLTIFNSILVALLALFVLFLILT